MWKPEGNERLINGIPVQYLRNTHLHEGAHRIVHRDATIDVYPDSSHGTRARAATIRRALTQLTVEGVVGCLVLAGVTNITVDGTPIVSASSVGRWRIDLADTGEVHATWIGGAGA